MYSCIIKNIIGHYGGTKQMAKVGYARVSSVGQSLDVQLDKLKDCDKIFKEKKSGRTDNRPQLKTCLDYVRDADDTLVITKLDRLARSTRDLLNITAGLEGKGVKLVVLDQNIDTSTPTGKLMLTMLGAIAEFENELRKERQADGIQMARSLGVKFGRKPTLTPEQIQEMKELRESGVMIKDLMAKYSLSKASVYRLLPNSVEVESA
jgi:DNA invertase Pin-like site-specific DNA recombinase